MQGSRSSSYEKFQNKPKQKRKLNQGNPHREKRKKNNNEDEFI